MNNNNCFNEVEIKNVTLKSQADGLPLSIIYTESDSPKGVIQCCHGMTEHKERYIPLLKFMAKNGYHCVIHDMRGHGKSLISSDDLGFFYKDGMNGCIEDLYTINSCLHEKYPNLPVFLFGHSMGSLEVRAYCKNHDTTISGLIVCGSPSYNKLTPIGHTLIKLMTLFKGERFRSQLINKMALGAYNEPFANESRSQHNWVSANRENIESYDRDPLCGFVFTLNGFSVLMELMKYVYSDDYFKITSEQLPVLFISGKDDPCRGSKKDFLDAISKMEEWGCSPVDWKVYEGKRHEILNETDAVTVMNDILNFINKYAI